MLACNNDDFDCLETGCVEVCVHLPPVILDTFPGLSMKKDLYSCQICLNRNYIKVRTTQSFSFSHKEECNHFRKWMGLEIIEISQTQANPTCSVL